MIETLNVVPCVMDAGRWRLPEGETVDVSELVDRAGWPVEQIILRLRRSMRKTCVPPVGVLLCCLIILREVLYQVNLVEVNNCFCMKYCGVWLIWLCCVHRGSKGMKVWYAGGGQ